MAFSIPEERPVLSTFVTIFTLLSLVPVALFAGTALFIFTTFTLASLLIAFFASIGVILFCFGFLILVLFGTLLFSLFLTGVTLAAYSFLRLALHVQREGPSNGLNEWGRETLHALRSQPKANPLLSSPLVPPVEEKKETRPDEDIIKNGPADIWDDIPRGEGKLSWETLGHDTIASTGRELKIKRESENEQSLKLDDFDARVNAAQQNADGAQANGARDQSSEGGADGVETSA